MNVDLPRGKYVVAVSGGVDSMVLLDMLAERPDVELVVAHFNHGIRPDSSEDEKLVVETARKHGLKTEVGHGSLSPSASEDQARRARYKFLEKVRQRHQADKIITAHHQDDLIETAILNILRGSGPKGLTAMMQNPEILRPLLDVPKQKIVKHAKSRGLNWREDPTNVKLNYLRNYVRYKVVGRLKPAERRQLLTQIARIAHSSAEKDKLIATISHDIRSNSKIDRQRFAMLPSEVADELMAFWLRQYSVSDIDRKTIQRLSLAVKTAPASTIHNVRGRVNLAVSSKEAHFTTSD